MRDIDREAVAVAGGSDAAASAPAAWRPRCRPRKIAGRFGVVTVVASGRRERPVTSILDGADAGTVFWPSVDRAAVRKHWIAYALKPAGALVVDAGARRALVDGGKSLLPSGVTRVDGHFGAGDAVRVVDEARRRVRARPVRLRRRRGRARSPAAARPRSRRCSATPPSTRSSIATIWCCYEQARDRRYHVTDIAQLARDAQAAGRLVAKAGAERRTAALVAIADAVDRRAAPRSSPPTPRTSPPPRRTAWPRRMLDRLRLDDERLAKMADAVREVAALPDPVGQTVKEWTRPNGLEIARRRIPLGVIAIIYESRPNVTTDAAALCLRAGNAVILRGGSEAFRSNRALMAARSPPGSTRPACRRRPCSSCRPPTATAMAELLQRDEEIDLVIPRGGEALIRFVAEHSRIPVIKHYNGNCHVFVERTADPSMALEICYNAKVQRPGVCNAAETILVDEAIATFVPAPARRAARPRRRRASRRRARPRRGPRAHARHRRRLRRRVPRPHLRGRRGRRARRRRSRHIERYGSSHTESIVTARRRGGRAASSTRSTPRRVMVNASTRFADGGELGLGAEIGISTTRLHAYGPMGAEELTTTKFVVLGDGQVRQ